MQNSNELFQKALQLMPGGVNSPVRAFRSVGGTPFFTERAEGCRLFTVDGVSLVDYVCTWGPAIHGHNPPQIREAVARALEAGTSFGTPNPFEVEMAERIIDMVPSIERVRMCNSGTEATMSAIRLARGFTGRDKVVKFAGCYHGHVDSLLVKAGSGALTFGYPDSAGVPEAFARETVVLPFNDEAALREAFVTHGPDIAAVILEPYPANCGLIPPREGYLQFLRDLCTEHGSVLVFDEVMTGFRIAPGGVQEKEGITPDLTALGKIIGGGLPVGAFGGRVDIMSCLAPEGPVYQAGTLSGNPLAMAAGIAALKMLETPGLHENLASAGLRIASALRNAAEEKGIPLQVPQCGSMFAMFFTENPVENFDQAIASNTDHFKAIFRHALDNGVYLAPSAFETCFISTAHDEDAITKTIEVLTNAIKAL
ncbi:MAG: glutamate-1-semialdehyde 2,1-aminomutase [Opitutales bacterium]|nr:glutamate-1-semialdehyde 2,1-aminomutase [Opitutales bacterium]